MMLLAYWIWAVVVGGFALMIGCLVVGLFRCSHPHHAVSWPVHGRSTCHNCQRVREYAWSDEMWGYDLSKPGRWHREV